MFSALTLKTWRDLWIHKRQSFAVIAAISVSTATLGAILISYAFLSQALLDNYQRSAPAMLTFQLEGSIASAKLSEISKLADIQRVELSRKIAGTITNQDGEAFPLFLFVVRDFNDFQVDIVDLEQGDWPTKGGQILIEKQALSVLNGRLGEEVEIDTPAGLSGSANIVGIGHDVSVAQAEWENIVYGYVDSKTLAYLGGESGFNLIKIGLPGSDLKEETIREQGNQIRQWLNELDIQVKGMRVASGKPPHANITDGMFMMQIAFGVMCCLLSTILVVNLISAILSKQVYQIGVMKSLGAKPHHIKQIYLRSTLTLCAIGTAIGLPLAYLIARLYAAPLANMMNIDIFDHGVPTWVLMVLLVFGFLIPLLTVLRPISFAAKTTIKKALMDFDADEDIQVPSWLDSLCSRLPIFTSELHFAARNIFRRKARFILTSAVMAVGGAILMATFNVSEAMKKAIAIDGESRLWSTMVRLNKVVDIEILNIPNNEVFNQQQYFPFYQSKTRLLSKESSALEKRLSHLQLTSPEKLLKPNMLKGTWLNGDEGQIVFSHLVANAYPEYNIGDTVNLQGGASYTLVGIAEVFGSKMLYTTGDGSLFNGVFLTDSTELEKLIEVMEKNNIIIERTIEASAAAKVIEDHFDIIFALLFSLAIITLLIAGKSVILTTSINTQERFREIGVLKAIGAGKFSLYAIILGESLWSGLLAWIAACFITLPISWLVSHWLGLLLVGVSIPLAIDSVVLLLIMPLLVMVSLMSAYFPARKIGGKSVREVFANV